MKQTRSTTKQDFSGEALSKTKHRGLTSLAFMELVPGADRVVRHICIRCIFSDKSTKSSVLIVSYLFYKDTILFNSIVKLHVEKFMIIVKGWISWSKTFTCYSEFLGDVAAVVRSHMSGSIPLE